VNEKPIDRRELSLMAKLSVPEASEPPWNLLGAATALFIFLVCLIVIGPSLALLLGENGTASRHLLLAGWSIGMALTIIFVAMNRRSSAESWLALRLQRGHTPLPLVLLYGVAISLAIGLLISLASGQFLPIPEIFGLLQRKPASVIAAASLLIVLQPVAETLVFQAIILPSLRWRLGPWGGVIAACALYTAIHLLVFSSSSLFDFWFSIAYPALASLAFCLLKVLTASTSAVIIARMGAGMIFLLTALALAAA
jgi:membrane protease YdiL (CAAX protease family)